MLEHVCFTLCRSFFWSGQAAVKWDDLRKTAHAFQEFNVLGTFNTMQARAAIKLNAQKWPKVYASFSLSKRLLAQNTAKTDFIRRAEI